MNYYTSDLHLGHNNIMKYENRPGNDIFEMNKILIDNINNTVNKNDTLYILGDFAFKTKNHQIGSIIDELNSIKCKVVLIIGNHDKDWLNNQKFKQWNESLDGKIKQVEIYDYKEIYDNGTYVILSHYPIEVWNHKNHEAIHLHGHTHDTGEEFKIKNRYNVGCMLHDYKPVTLNDLINKNKIQELKNLELLTKEEKPIINHSII